MTQSNAAAKAEIIRKLLDKAEAAGTTPEERDSLGAKAAALMIKYGIDEAVARATQTGAVRAEAIITKKFVLADVPKSYSHEFALLGCGIAKALGCSPFLSSVGGGAKHMQLVGFESDVALVEQLYTSLVRQCTLNLAQWYAKQPTHRMSGTDRFNAKRGFISGFAVAVGERMQASRKEAVAEAGSGTDLVLIDRKRQVDDWLARMFNLGKARGRSYDAASRGAGWRAGQTADIGQRHVGGAAQAHGPRALGN